MKKRGTMMLGIATILIASLLAGAGTFAYFSDTETSRGNTFTASTNSPDLIVWWPAPPYHVPSTRYDDESGNSLPTVISVDNLLPGDSGETRCHVNNIGDMDGTLYFKITNVENDENTCIEPEQEAEDDPTSLEGELGEHLLITVLYGDDNWDISIYYTAIEDESLNDLEGDPQLLGDLFYEGQGLNGKDIIIQWTLPTSTTSIVQTDKVTFDIEFILNQKV